MKYTYTFIFILIASLSFSQIQVGGGLGFGTGVENLCIDFKGKKDFTDQIDGSVSLNFFLPEKVKVFGGEIKSSIWTINLDGHYNLLNSDNSNVYGLAGINISNIKVKSEYNDPTFGSFGGTASDSEFGLNIGGGGELILNDNMSGFGEVKYVISNADQLVIIAGVLFNIGG